MDPDSTRTCPLASSSSASLETSRQVMLAQPLRLRKSWTGRRSQRRANPRLDPRYVWGIKDDSQGDRMHGCRTMAQILGRGYVQKLRITFLKQEMLSPTSFAILSSIFSDTRPQQWQGIGSHSGADKGIYIPFLKQSSCSTPSSR